MVNIEDIPNIYNDPIIFRRRLGTPIQPFKEIKESLSVEKHYVLLSEIPNRDAKVKVTGLNRNFYEVRDEFLDENTYRVDYTNGIVYFHESLHGRTLNFEYVGEGVMLYPDSRVYLTGDKGFPNVRDKFKDVDRAIEVERSRITEQIISHPQPSEIVDARVDYNGKVHRVLKDRIDAEQKKIEEAYVDAKGVRYSSLKERIDSLQLATEESFDEQDVINSQIWAEINLVPGMISLETGKLEQRINDELVKLTSRIDMVPDQIKLQVEQLKEYADGEFARQASTINMLSDRIDLKVDANGIISSINLSKEGVAINGAKVRITGETHIENGVIKSAHIDSLSANKIRAGTLRSQNNNTYWNLDTGEFSTGAANFTMGGGAKIRFTDPGNRIIYTQQDPQTRDNYTAGFGVGRNINRRFPFSYFGTSQGNNVHATDGSNFTGFIANTDARREVDNIGNSVVGQVFHIRDKAVSFQEGFRFDLQQSVNVFRPINTSRHTYDIGTQGSRFRNVYAAAIRNNGTVHIRDSHRDSGWLLQTRYAGDGSAITFRGLNGRSYNYSIGGRGGVHERITTIRLKNKPNVSSDRRLKEDIQDLDLGLDFILALKPTVFRFKKTEADKKRNKKDFGFIAQDIEQTLKDFNIDVNDTSILNRDDDGMLSLEHEQFIAPIVNSIKELHDKDIDKDKRIQELEKEISNLKSQLAEMTA